MASGLIQTSPLQPPQEAACPLAGIYHGYLQTTIYQCDFMLFVLMEEGPPLCREGLGDASPLGPSVKPREPEPTGQTWCSDSLLAGT